MKTELTTLDTTRIDDTRIGAVRPLITPALLEEKLPVPAAAHPFAGATLWWSPRAQDAVRACLAALRP